MMKQVKKKMVRNTIKCLPEIKKQNQTSLVMGGHMINHILNTENVCSNETILHVCHLIARNDRPLSGSMGVILAVKI